MNNIIDNTEQLSNFCHNLLSVNPEFIAIDTEFISNRQYRRFPKLCLIQICYHDIAVIIDVLSDGIDLSPLKDILFNPNITKVFHDFKHDVLTLLTIFDRIPFPVMDTQIMAMMGNYYHRYISYSDLVYSYLDIKIDKNHTRTDWLKRPLSTEQINYALSDVTHLLIIYQKLFQKLEKMNRIQWVKDDMANMIENLLVPYSTKNDSSCMVRQLLSQYKKEKKLLEGISDAKIYQISYAVKHTYYTFREIMKKDYIKDILRDIEQQKNKENFDSNNKKAVIYLLQLLIEQYCITKHISHNMISSTAEISRIANNDITNVRLLSGWRYQEIGKEVLSILRGELSLNINITEGIAHLTMK